MSLFKSKTLNLGDKKVKLRELSVGLIYKIDENLAKDDIKTILKGCSDLSDDEIDNLGLSVAKALYDEVINLTYDEKDKNSGESKKK